MTSPRSEVFKSRVYPTRMPHTGRTKLYVGCFRVLGFDKLTAEAQRAVRHWQASATLANGIYARERADWRRVTPQWTRDQIAQAEVDSRPTR